MCEGISREEALEQGICVSCQRPVTGVNFGTDTSLREYECRALCQLCQDEEGDLCLSN